MTGSFDPVTQNLLFLDALLDYQGGDGNDVTLELQRNDVAFADVGHTRNQIATGAAIDTLDGSNAVWRAIALTNDQDLVRASFDALSGEIYASAQSALIEDSRFVGNAAIDRVRSAFDTAGASYAPVLAYRPGEAPVIVAPDYAGPVVWADGVGSWASTDSDGNAASLDRSTGGFLLGADRLVGDWRAGILAGYSHSKFKAKDRGSSASSDNWHLGLYGGSEWADLALRAGLAYSWHDIDTRRAISIHGLTDSVSAGYDAGTFQAFGEFGYGIEAGPARFEPFVNLAHASFRDDDFAESGGAAALTSRSDTTGVTFTTLGVRAEHRLMLYTTIATLKGTLGWRHAFGDVVPTSTNAFAGSDAFIIAGAPIARDSAVVEAGFDLELSPQSTFGLNYAGQLAESAQDHGSEPTRTMRF